MIDQQALAEKLPEPFLVCEGSSLRTDEELDVLFITHVRDIAACYGTEEQQAEAVQNLYDATVLINRGCICCSEEELPDIADDAAELLQSLGFEVTFGPDGGYAIYESEA